jgi:hypothetical protein
MDDVTDDLRRMGIRCQTEKARNRDQWRLIVEDAKAHPGLQHQAEEASLPMVRSYNCCEFFHNLETKHFV